MENPRKKRCPGNSPFCLGLPEWDCCGTQGLLTKEDEHLDSAPDTVNASKESAVVHKPMPTKIQKMSLQLRKEKKKVLSPASRFTTTVSNEEVDKSSKGCIPKNTSRNTSWAVRVFNQWIEQRNKRSDVSYPTDLLKKSYDSEVICECLQRFVSEARRTDGTEYPPKTLYQLLSGLLRYSREKQVDPVNFLNRKDPRFKKLHATCDVVFRSLHEAGIGTVTKSAKVISKSDENDLWDSGVLNTYTPVGLQNAVFYYLGKVCCLRGGEEQRGLKPSQFKRYYDPDRYLYSEHGSKNRNGGFFQLDVENKNVTIYRSESNGERCLVSLLDLYLSKLPQAAFEQDIFYCRPLDQYGRDGPWYSKQPKGKHSLSKMVKAMLSKSGAGCASEYSNHSLRASGATELFQAEVPEKVIQDMTGHRSVKALRQYEKVSDVQKKAACNILTGKAVNNYHNEVERVKEDNGPDTKSKSALGDVMKSMGSACNSAMPLQLGAFNPVINSNSTGTVNFIVNVCPSGNMAVGNKNEARYDKQNIDIAALMDGVDIENFFSDFQ